ncbi:hypothetical protein Rsub_04045 [Raphidocelis subcapitata]|uniref:Uncharacterized protein n=1 Tax=Raphidocelis subcapitata TaxID=307507 RepID=A0A2V0NVT1_9CHLO|nr:hypothetical protein Rsub_04045 [Raphidocelis subcapitata]|eukprot:GBF91741.1 hypothetical protein Rsub_04045 [Raphidocelis subcapitata]
MPDPATAAAESSTIWVTAASSVALVVGSMGATVIGAFIASRALDDLDPQLAEDEAAGLAGQEEQQQQQQQQQQQPSRRRRMTLEEAEAEAAAAAAQGKQQAEQKP